jgi:hypothetical protein
LDVGLRPRKDVAMLGGWLRHLGVIEIRKTSGYKVSTQVQDIVPVEVTEIIEEYPPLWYFSHTPRYNKLYLAISPMDERYDHAQNPLILLDKLFSSGG